MKKGCAYIFVLLIFLIGVGYYIWQKYGEEIKDKARERIVKIAFENLNEKISGIDPEINADSLINIISERILDKTKDLNLDEIGKYSEDIVNKISEKINDADINSPDLSEIEKMIDDYEK